MKVKKLITIGVLLLFTSIPGIAQDFDTQNKYANYIKKYDYKNALLSLESLREDDLTVTQKRSKNILQIFQDVEDAPEEKSNSATLKSELSESQKKDINLYYRNAQKNILLNKREVARDILIYILYIDPGNRKAELLLEKALDYPKGTYKIFNVSERYFRRSYTYFLGGNYLLAIQDLEVLVVIDKDNDEVYERLGSAKYMIDEKKEAVDAWATALFLNPKSQGLDKIIKETKAQLDKEAKEQLAKKKAINNKKVTIEDPITMGVFKKQSQALEMASTYKQKGMRVRVDEQDNGKYAVVISKKELSEKFSKAKN